MDRIAVEELLSVNLLPTSPEPIRIERFVEKRFRLSAIGYDELPGRVLGYTQFGPSGVEAIFVARSLAEEGTRAGERRINSTIAHEAGHGLLHGHLFVLDSFPMQLFESDADVSSVRILCRDDSPTEKRRARYDGRWWEFQANRMIGCLLLPKPLLLAAIGPYLTSGSTLAIPRLADGDRNQAIRELAEVFDVNRPVAEIRLSNVCPPENVDQLTL
jgi:Zn-dependent peptidase ImmA (M78 family)